MTRLAWRSRRRTRTCTGRAMIFNSSRLGPNSAGRQPVRARHPHAALLPARRRRWRCGCGLALIVAVAGFAAAVAVRRHGHEMAGVAITGLLAALLSPVAWIHHFCWIVDRAGRDHRRRPGLAAGGDRRRAAPSSPPCCRPGARTCSWTSRCRPGQPDRGGRLRAGRAGRDRDLVPAAGQRSRPAGRRSRPPRPAAQPPQEQGAGRTAASGVAPRRTPPRPRPATPPVVPGHQVGQHQLAARPPGPPPRPPAGRSGAGRPAARGRRGTRPRTAARPRRRPGRPAPRTGRYRRSRPVPCPRARPGSRTSPPGGSCARR